MRPKTKLQSTRHKIKKRSHKRLKTNSKMMKIPKNKQSVKIKTNYIFK